MHLTRNENYDVFDVPLGTIYVDHNWNCRDRFLSHTVEELAASMQEQGMIFPLQVQQSEDVPFELPSGKLYRLVSGFRRYEAARISQWDTVPVRILPKMPDEDLKLLNLTENIERKDLNVLEEAIGIEKLYPEERFSTSEVSRKVKKGIVWVRQRRRLLKLPESVKLKFAAGALLLTDLKAIEESEDVIAAANEISKLRAGGAFKRGRPRTTTSEEKAAPQTPRQRTTHLLKTLIERGVEGLPLKCLAWVLGAIPDEELNRAIDEQTA